MQDVIHVAMYKVMRWWSPVCKQPVHREWIRTSRGGGGAEGGVPVGVSVGGVLVLSASAVDLRRGQQLEHVLPPTPTHT